MPANESIPFYEPGKAITCYATAAITGCRLVKISATRPGPELNTDTTGGNLRVATCGAGQAAFGVAAYDALINTILKVWHGSGWIVPIFSVGALSAGVLVKSDATGGIVAIGGGEEALAVGQLVDDVGAGALAQVALFK
jgi:hypothetical protein